MLDSRKVIAIILAAGSGSRYQNSKSHDIIPKQFAPLAGKPLVNYSLDAFASSALVDSLIVVVPSANRDIFTDGIHKTMSAPVKKKLYKVIDGGNSRLASAAKGLDAVDDAIAENYLIAVHDAARPLISLELIENCIKAAAANDGAALAIPATDSLGFAPESINSARHLKEILPRSAYYAMQTPQVFGASLLHQAYQWALQQPNQDDFTDESSIVLRYNSLLKLAVVEGSSNNIKLTYPTDSYKLEAILQGNPATNSND